MSKRKPLDLETKANIRYWLLKENLLMGQLGTWDELVLKVSRKFADYPVKEIAEQMLKQGAFTLQERKIDQINKSIANSL